MIPSHAALTLAEISFTLQFDRETIPCPRCSERFFAPWKLDAHLRVTHGK